MHLYIHIHKDARIGPITLMGDWRNSKKCLDITNKLSYFRKQFPLRETPRKGSNNAEYLPSQRSPVARGRRCLAWYDFCNATLACKVTEAKIFPFFPSLSPLFDATRRMLIDANDSLGARAVTSRGVWLVSLSEATFRLWTFRFRESYESSCHILLERC